MVIGEMDPLKRGIMQRPVLQIDMRYCMKKCALIGSDCGNLRRMKNEMKNDSMQSAEGICS